MIEKTKSLKKEIHHPKNIWKAYQVTKNKLKKKVLKQMEILDYY
jgi:hypothetical protein